MKTPTENCKTYLIAWILVKMFKKKKKKKKNIIKYSNMAYII
jgi:hypothetical protein